MPLPAHAAPSYRDVSDALRTGDGEGGVPRGPGSSRMEGSPAVATHRGAKKKKKDAAELASENTLKTTGLMRVGACELARKRKPLIKPVVSEAFCLRASSQAKTPYKTCRFLTFLDTRNGLWGASWPSKFLTILARELARKRKPL